MIVNVVLTIITAALFLGAGVTKVTMQPRMVTSAEHFGLSKPVYRMIGGLEVLAVIGLLIGLISGAFWSAIGILAAIGLVLMMIGALSFHIRAKDPIKEVAPAGVAGLLSVAVLISQIAA